MAAATVLPRRAPHSTATLPMSQVARGKRARPSEAESSSDFDAPAMVVRKMEGMTTVVAARGVKGGEEKAGEGSAYRKGMYLAFIDDAFLQRSKVRRLSHIVSRDYHSFLRRFLGRIGGDSIRSLDLIRYSPRRFSTQHSQSKLTGTFADAVALSGCRDRPNGTANWSRTSVHSSPPPPHLAPPLPLPASTSRPAHRPHRNSDPGSKRSLTSYRNLTKITLRSSRRSSPFRGPRWRSRSASCM